MADIESSSEDLLYTVEDGIGRVTFNRPQARNAMKFAMYDRLAQICDEVGEDPTMRALVLTGAGDKAFASGTDISQFREFKTPEDALEYEARIDRVLVALERCKIPTIAAIAGACTGGGAGMAAACDLRVATKASRFGFPVGRTLGNCLSISNYTRLAALVGPAAVKDMVFTARLLGADEAKQVGFIGEVVEDREALDTRVDELAKTVASMAPLTLRATKEALYRIREKSRPDEGQDLVIMCYMSNDFREGMDAFLTKRTPTWTGT
ncbi:enoyl-CoA hydratase/isomerase family protein [Acidisphaera sp. L21]|uniref:enoyl-CoA hydratase/isomerase family protein n=1 Tax=Acidisphaera sp. L21 TaxID=1641851 RepID=UPI00131E6067|nr:enoyl-CoA hydratase/isomerase family protein [Acidisphaera sp. L21]